jgi:hypothetical protein
MLSEVHEIFQSLARLINDFGPFVFGLVAFLLIIVLLIILLIYLAKAIGNNNNNNNPSDDEYDRIRRLEDKIDRLSNSDDKAQKDKSIIEIFLRLSDSLKHNVKEILDEVNADRVEFYLFHNGTHSLNNIPFLKASCISEVDKAGVSKYHLIKKHKDIPIGLMDDIIVNLLKKHTFVIYKNENKIDAIISKLFFDEQDKTCIFSGIFEYGDGELLGFIVAEYDNVEKFEDHDLAYKLEKMAKASRQTSSAMLAISALKQ